MQILCDICGFEMTFKERIKSKKPYRIRRFICDCGHQQTIFADGYRDIVKEEEWALKAVEKMYKQESENRNF